MERLATEIHIQIVRSLQQEPLGCIDVLNLSLTSHYFRKLTTPFLTAARDSLIGYLKKRLYLPPWISDPWRRGVQQELDQLNRFVSRVKTWPPHFQYWALHFTALKEEYSIGRLPLGQSPVSEDKKRFREQARSVINSTGRPDTATWVSGLTRKQLEAKSWLYDERIFRGIEYKVLYENVTSRKITLAMQRRKPWLHMTPSKRKIKTGSGGQSGGQRGGNGRR
ncbi:uncharacterized protein KY384_008806 [Bacidia gigantensis]|uniref:uncharacterized protein n=1 Tax=Bacidia gigantensis TaxID=2732470 RepID=UPI001D042914|nr:uncharacterized protein KY384_008806 [Bacidia gigantensis]KAG8526605.1 hypothetical protein KY384_008806 [Bacidia gigantensis]